MRLAYWCLRHPVSMNLFMFFLILLGLFSAFNLQREIFPKFAADQIRVTLVMEGGSTPDQIDRNIVQLIYPRLDQIEGIKKIESRAFETHAEMILDLESGYDLNIMKVKVKDQIDQITTFPEQAKEPTVIALELFSRAIQIAIHGENASEGQLREVADWVISDLKAKNIIKRGELYVPRELEIAIHIPTKVLEAKGLTFSDIAQQIKNYSLEQRIGEVRSSKNTIILKGNSRKTALYQLRKIPIAFPNGEFLTLGELTNWNGFYNGFSEEMTIIEHNQKKSANILIQKSDTEDIIDLCTAVKEYVATTPLPYGLKMVAFQDLSVFVQERLSLILRNALTGLALVLVTLTLFLEWKIALWTASGIGFSLFCVLTCLELSGTTINMISLFGFLMSTGVVVDDAIVISEKFFQHRKEGLNSLDSAKAAIQETFWPVVSMVMTTIIAFIPLLYMSGIIGKFIFSLPLVVIFVLIFSLIESVFILPSHLALHCGEHDGPLMRLIHFVFYPAIIVLGFLHKKIHSALEYFIQQVMRPLVKFSIHHRYSLSVFFLSVLVFLISLFPAGIVKTALFPKPDAETYVVHLEFEKGTNIRETQKHTRKVLNALVQTGIYYENLGQTNPIKETFLEIGQFGSHKAHLTCQLKSIEQGRGVAGGTFLDKWRDHTPFIPQAFAITFSTEDGGPPSQPVELLFSSTNEEQLLEIETHFLSYLSSIENVVDITTSNRPGSSTLEISLKPEAFHLNISENEVIREVQAIYEGTKLDTFYQEDNEIKIYLRAPSNERNSIQQLKELRLQSGLHLDQVANLKFIREPEDIRRIDGARSILISAGINFSKGANAVEIRKKIDQEFLLTIAPLHYSDVLIRVSGESKEGEETINSLLKAFLPAMAAIFFILATLFNSYTQPLVIMLTIPFSLVGSIIGHYILDIPFNLLSGFGLVALTGIVVNDSLVLIDCANNLIRKNIPLEEALIGASLKRFRPIFLTSLTTIAGMSPILFETSFQAQFLIPMVTTIVFGIGFSTLLILLLVPVAFHIFEDLNSFLSKYLRSS